MTPSDDEPPATERTLAETVSDVLSVAPTPLKLADLLKKLPKPAKPKRAKGQPPPSGHHEAVAQAVEDACRIGRAFRHPSGPQGAERYWGRDEAEAIRGEALRAASTPAALPKIKTAAAKASKGADKSFVELTIAEMIEGDILFEHPAKTKAGGPLFAAYPPPPPVPVFERDKFKAKLAALVRSFEKLLADAGASADELFAALRHRVTPGEAPPPQTPAGLGVDALILSAVANAGPGSVLSLAELRAGMPGGGRGPAFDEAVLRLADEERVRVYADSDPASMSAGERAACVTDGNGRVFKTIKKG